MVSEVGYEPTPTLVFFTQYNTTFIHKAKQ